MPHGARTFDRIFSAITPPPSARHDMRRAAHPFTDRMGSIGTALALRQNQCQDKTEHVTLFPLSQKSQLR